MGPRTGAPASAARRTAGRAAAAAARGNPDAGTPSGHLGGCGVAGAAEAAEDLPPDRVVPVAERATAGVPVGAEGAAAQHLVFRAEESLRVFGVGEGGEARVTVEV